MQTTLIYTNQVQKQIQYQLQEHLKMTFLNYWNGRKITVLFSTTINLKALYSRQERVTMIKAFLSGPKVNLYNKSRQQSYLCNLWPTLNLERANQQISKVRLYWEYLKSPSKKDLLYLLQWKPLKNDDKCFLFHLKSSFRSQDI